jgi:photosystem II stability/assembly factor-like uncharacterized protein
VKTRIYVLTTLASLIGFAQANVDEQSFIAPLVKESLLLGATNGQSSVIVGERGHILVNTSPQDLDPKNYTQIVSPTKVTLTNVYSIDNLVWAVGHDATIIRSTDAGMTWSVVKSDPELDRPLLGIYFFNKSEGIAVGAYGLFYRSTDGGESWVQERHPSMLSEDDNEYLDSIKDDEAFYLEELSFISPHLNQLSFNNGILYVAGEAGLLATSEDMGRSWERLDIDYQGSFFDVGVLSPEIALAVGLRGNIFTLKDDNYARIPACLTTSLNGVIQSKDNVFVVGNNGVLLSIDPQKLSSTNFSPKNSEGCRTHASVTLIETDFSDAILTGMVTDKGLLLVTSGGLKTVAMEE